MSVEAILAVLLLITIVGLGRALIVLGDAVARIETLERNHATMSGRVNEMRGEVYRARR